jgi:S-layer protein (TIGR01567 family)
MAKSLNEHIWSLVERLYIHVYTPNQFIQLLNENGIDYQSSSYSGLFDLDKKGSEGALNPNGYNFMKNGNNHIAHLMKKFPIQEQFDLLSQVIYDDAITETKEDGWNYFQEYVKDWYPAIIEYLEDAKVEFDYEGKSLEHHPFCFISYSWDSKEHKDWVRFLAEKLCEKGVHVILDEWHLKKGDDLLYFMETSIDRSEYVVLILTPEYASKADNRKGGVGYEYTIINGHMYNMHIEDVKYLPILREGNMDISVPKYLKTRVYIPFKDSDDFDASFKDLLHAIYDVPKHSPPPIGKNPFLKKKLKKIAPHKSVSKQNIESLLKEDKTNSSSVEKVRFTDAPAAGTICVGDTTYAGTDLHNIIGFDDDNFIEINATNFVGFVSQEKLKIYGGSFVDDRNIKKGGLVYKTQIEQINFKSDAWEDTYNIMELFGDVYVSLKNNTPGKLTNLLVDSGDKYTLRVGSALELAGDYELTAKQIDVVGNKVWMELSKNGEFIEDKVIHVGDKIDGTWIFETNVADEINVEVLRVNITNIFQGQVDSLVVVEGIWLIDFNNVLEIEVGDEFGVLKVDSIADSSIIMVNEDSILLTRNSIQEIAEGMKLRVADSDYLTFNLIREYV